MLHYVVTMLQGILSRRDLSNILLLKDVLGERGRQLAQCLITSWVTRGDSVHVLCLDRHKDDLLRAFPVAVAEKIVIHDGFTDDKVLPAGQSKYDLHAWVEVLSNVKEPFVVVVDTLTTLMMHWDFDRVYRALLYLSRNANVQLVCALIHEDVHEEHHIAKLCHLATTCVTLATPEAGVQSRCRIVHRKSNGRAVKEEQDFTINEDLTITDIRKVEAQKAVPKDPPKPDPTANLTFNLRLSGDEKTAKDNLVLPYLKKPSGGSGEIFYVMEREDDFDEEDDPDDDLNF